MKNILLLGLLFICPFIQAMPVEEELKVLHHARDFIYYETINSVDPDWDLYTSIIFGIADREEFLAFNNESRYILVNKSDYHLRVIAQGEELLYNKVIIGRKSRPTPVHTARLTHIVINPFWNVPRSLARRDVLPSIRKKPDADRLGYIHHKGYRFFLGEDELNPNNINWSAPPRGMRIRQEPGNINSLGRIKFMFPDSPYSIYIHDTPSKRLFDRDVRNLSSGCIRLQDPVSLANILLDESFNARSMINNPRNRDRWIKINNPITVHVVDWDVWVTNDGEVKYK